MLELRDAAQRDEDFLKHCIREAYQEFPRLLARGEASLAQAAENDYERAGGGFAHVAEQDGRPVAAAWWLPEEDQASLVVAYYVEPEARGQGVATRLLETGLAEARRRGAKLGTIRTHPDNAASVALARKLGFEPLVAVLRQKL